MAMDEVWRLDDVQIGPCLATASYGLVALNSWHDRVTIADLDVNYRASKRLIARMGGRPIVNLTMVHAGMTVPGDEVRRHAEELVRKVANEQLAAVTVLEGTGFYAATARVVTSGMFLLSRNEMQRKMAASIEAAADWIGTRIGLHPPEIGELIAAARDLRGRHLAQL